MKRCIPILLVAFFGLVQSAVAQIPNTIGYQGVLTDASGTLLPDGDYELTFSLYDVASGGLALWTETQTAAVTGGVFSVDLGSAIALSLPFDIPYWLGVSVGTEAELSPRVSLTASAYSLSTRALNGTGNKVPGAGPVGIGTSTPDPTVALDVRGPVTIDATIAGKKNAGAIDIRGSNVNLGGGNLTFTGDSHVWKDSEGNPLLTIDVFKTTVKKPLEIEQTISLGTGTDKMTLSGFGITYADGTTQSSASGTGVGSGTVNDAPLNLTNTSTGQSVRIDPPDSNGDSWVVFPGDTDFKGTGLKFEAGLGSGMSTLDLNPFFGASLTSSTGAMIDAPTVGVTTDMFEVFPSKGSNVFSASPTMVDIISDKFMVNTMNSRLDMNGFTTLVSPQIMFSTPNTGLDMNGMIDFQAPRFKFMEGVDPILDFNLSGMYVMSRMTTFTGSPLLAGEYRVDIDGGLGLHGGLFSRNASGNPGFTVGPDGALTVFNSDGTTAIEVKPNQDPGSQYTITVNGNLDVKGLLMKLGGTFRIDHPLDPENKYLLHSFIESPDMMNVYNGNVLLDTAGSADVKLPTYFEALNIEYRYQLTPVGAPGPNLYVAEEISGNKFRIAGGTPGTKVSWQVTGIRNDKYARENRIQVEVDKN